MGSDVTGSFDWSALLAAAAVAVAVLSWRAAVGARKDTKRMADLEVERERRATEAAHVADVVWWVRKQEWIANDGAMAVIEVTNRGPHSAESVGFDVENFVGKVEGDGLVLNERLDAGSPPRVMRLFLMPDEPAPRVREGWPVIHISWVDGREGLQHYRKELVPTDGGYEYGRLSRR